MSKQQIKVSHEIPKDAERMDYAAVQDQREVRDQMAEQAIERELSNEAIAPELSPLAMMMQEAQSKREYLKELSFELPDGRVVDMAPPKVATSLIVTQIMQNEQGMNPIVVTGAYNSVKAMLHVQVLDGRPVARPTNKTELQELMNRIGNVGCEIVEQMYAIYFAPPPPSAIKILKKS
ncbi:MAG: hypothetical protein K2W95_15725 [Candidatus Obscuribacterales bacterium]|nr:hypothetical protein [Candidatus Obscuribacterales bacterium]